MITSTINSNMQQSLILSLTVVLTLSLVVQIRAEPSSSISDLIALCKGERLKIKTASQLLAIDRALEVSKPAECSVEVQKGIKDMATIARDRSACTMNKATAISRFVEDHLKVDTNTGRGQLPESLTLFAIAYGMRVSNVCKNNMMNKFSEETYSRLHEKFKSNLTKLIDYLRKDSPLSHILMPIYKTAEVVLPSDLMQLAPGIETELGTNVIEDETLVKLKLVCKETFQPLYEQTLLPLAQLIRAGFNHRGDFTYPKKNKKIAQFWFVTVFLCETVKRIKTTDNEGNRKDQQEEKEKEQEEIPELNIKKEISAAEEEAFRKAFEESEQKQQVSKLLPQQGAPKPDEMTTDTINVKEAPERKRRSFVAVLRNYEGGKPLSPLRFDVNLGDTIIGEDETSLKALVKSFDSNKNEVDRVREMILDRSLAIFKMMFMNSGDGPILKKLLAGFKTNSNKDLERAKESLIELASAKEADSTTYHAVHHAAKAPVYAYKASKWTITKAATVVGLFGMLIPAMFSDRANDAFSEMMTNLLY